MSKGLIPNHQHSPAYRSQSPAVPVRQDTVPGTGEIRKIYERITDAIIALDRNWNYVYLNQRAEELHQRNMADLLGKNIWKEYPDLVNEPFWHCLHDAMESQQPVRAELFYSKSGKWFENFIYPAADGLSVYYRDITRHKVTEQELIRSEHQYRSLVEQAADAIIIIDFSGRCLDINSTALSLTGFARQELEGMNLFDLLVQLPGDRPLRLKEIMDGNPVMQERRIRKKDGSWFYAELNSKRLEDNRILIIGRDVSERHRMEDEIQESEFRYSTLFEEGPDGICFYDIRENRYLRVNNRMTELFGFTEQEFLQMGVTDICFPEDVQQNPPLFLRMEKGQTATNERFFRKKDGTGIWIETTTRRLTNDNFVSFMRDISGRKEAEKTIHENELRWKLALDTSELGVWEMNFEKNTAFISEKTKEQTGFTGEDDLSKPAFWLNAIYEEDRPGVVEKFIRTIKGEDPFFDASFRVLCADKSLKWFRFTGNVTGRDQLGRALQITGVHEHITERISREMELHLKEAAIDSSISAIGMADLNGFITYVNKAAVKLLGAPDSSRLLGRNITGFLQGPGTEDAVQSIISKGFMKGESGMVKLDGVRFPVEFTAHVIRDTGGKPVCLFGSFIDISDRKTAQARLAESETLFREIAENSPSGIVLLDKFFRFKYISASARRITGYAEEEVIGRDPADFTHPADMSVLGKQLRDLVNTPGKVFSAQYRFLYSDGKWHTVESTFSNLLHLKDVEVISVNFRDITMLKNTQQDLEEREETFNRLFHESSEPVLLLDGIHFIDCNEATVKKLGFIFKEELLHRSPWEISPLRQPDGSTSRQKARRMIKQALEKGYNHFEWQHKRADGSLFMVEVMLTPILLRGRQLFYTVWHDISDREKARETLQQTLKELSDHKYALDIATIVSFSDPQGNITYVNENFEKLYGYSKKEIIGVNHNILNSGVHPPAFWKQFWETIRNGTVMRAEVCNKAKNGTLHWADTTIIPFLNEKGKPYQFLAIRTDITEKRKLERELKERERLEQIRNTETALEAQERERNYLGQELHDNVNQILVGTKLILSVVAEDPDKHREVLNSSILNIQHAIEENRRLSHSLATPDLSLASLPKQIREMALEMFFHQSVKLSFRTRGFREDRLDDRKKITLYRIAQEQCTNIIKYARASRVEFRLTMRKDQVVMQISDNGAGMEQGKNTDGIGIRNMKGRLSIYDGQLEVESSPGNGFTLRALLPL